MILGSIRSLSPDETTLTLLLAALFGLTGYRISSRHRLLRGVTPWRFPSFVWALICFIIGPIGIVVVLVAEVTTKPRLPSTLARIPARFDGSNRIPGQGVRAPRPASPQTTSAALAYAQPAPTPSGPPPPKDEHGATGAFGWYDDPTKRHQIRYFDGRGWTEYVADNGVRSENPL